MTVIASFFAFIGRLDHSEGLASQFISSVFCAGFILSTGVYSAWSLLLGLGSSPTPLPENAALLSVIGGVLVAAGLFIAHLGALREAARVPKAPPSDAARLSLVVGFVGASLVLVAGAHFAPIPTLLVSLALVTVPMPRRA